MILALPGWLSEPYLNLQSRSSAAEPAPTITTPVLDTLQSSHDPSIIGAQNGPVSDFDISISGLENRTVEGWAVLAVKEDYTDVGLPESENLVNNFVNLHRFAGTLEHFGWKRENILLLKGDVTTQSLDNALNWLADNADSDDVVVFYWHGHGEYVRKNLHWKNFFPERWAKIQSTRRILILDTCRAEEFTEAVAEDPNPNIAIGSVSKNELGWAGLWEEGLPITGGVFTSYFLEGLLNPVADLNRDGAVSVQEAVAYAQPLQSQYMHQVVMGIPRYKDLFPRSQVNNPASPSVAMQDSSQAPILLDLNAYYSR